MEARSPSALFSCILQVDESLSPVEAILKYGRSDHLVQQVAYIRVRLASGHVELFINRSAQFLLPVYFDQCYLQLLAR